MLGLFLFTPVTTDIKEPHMKNIGEYIRNQRYSYYEGESWEEMSKRVGEHIAKGEKQEKEEKKWAEIFTHSLEQGYLLPGGRVLANAGRIGAMLLNCFLIQPEDSRESLGKCFGDYFKILGTGGGCGLSYSKIRPKGSLITSGGDSSGVLGWGDIHNEISAKVKVGGGRRGATMFSLDYRHPEVEDFIISKNNVANKDKWQEILELVYETYGSRPDLVHLLKEQMENKRLIETNISVEIDNNFLEMAEKGQDYDLVWRGSSYKKVNAKEIWQKMMRNALESGDPGTMNLGRANHYSNSHYFWKLVGTNPYKCAA